MVRVIIKGGVWKNTEDEILKAAIMKYGKNQWSRIASLLHRKSAKQCKARWFEWLDPGIKKTEWSREEDEKLLHLAKIMPTQWRTMAPIVGRTAAQCLERYEQLLDEAQKKAEGLEDDVTAARKLKPGEIDPTPETKPARPDPIDMDDDELEMLSEARARLANTQGKKAKRKARERQLSEARRLTSLQKRREMRAAGIAIGNYKRRRPNQVDYSAEIPFEKPIPAGFHDPSEDIYTSDDKHQRAMDDHQKPRRQEVENELKRQDRDKLKRKKQEEETPDAIFKNKEKKRSKLILPAPQISDKELEQIVKIGHASDSIRAYADGTATSTLLTDYAASARTNAIASRTSRTPAARDVIQMEAENILALTNVETPLKGGLNTPLHESNFSSALPVSEVVATPNTVLNAVAATPGTAALGKDAFTPSGGTPFRDQMGINEQVSAFEQKAELRKALGQLPKPKNDYEIVAPEEEGEDGEDEGQNEEGWVEDAAERAEGRAKLRAERRQREFAKRSQVIQRYLPRPSKVNEFAFKSAAGKGETIKSADDLIKAEMEKLLRWDVEEKRPDYIPTQEDLSAAAQLIKQETESGRDMNAEMWAIVEQCNSELILSKGKFLRLGVLSRADQAEALHQQFLMHRDWMAARAKKTTKMEKKLKIKLGGYASIYSSIVTKLNEVHNELDLTNIDMETFRRLSEHEEKAIQKRLSRLREETKRQQDRERRLQHLYSAHSQNAWNIRQTQMRNDATVSAQPVQYNGTATTANGQ
ncbi:hypothetical protein WR25_08024 [Diploscapter pachys]|uniref:Cell division cycle 5-like protein n=1 Tax=Diploscapter pachys TaxID=2018661 RepID=A0A2A2JDN7_9BILA|nr:hypothetical protein WR25_08024 [Diploscapter pachys]